MILVPSAFALSWALALGSVAASQPPMDITFKTRNAPRSTDDDTFKAIGRALSAVRVQERNTVIQNSTSIEKSWEDAVLFSYTASKDGQVGSVNASTTAGVEITCTTCYVKGDILAQFIVNGSFNATSALLSFKKDVESDVLNITNTAFNKIKTYVESIFDNPSNGVSHRLPAFPTIPLDFNLDNITDIPECQMRFQFDGLELFMQTDIQLSAGATYTLNLYSSESPLGIRISQGLQLGVIFAIDLILDVEAEIDIASGFHIKLDDGLVIDIAMFQKDISNITFPGGRFEFLPVIIQSAGSLTAVLRVGIHCGLELETKGFSDLSFSAGVEVGIYADVAEFVTNVTQSPASDTSGCKLRMVEEYTLALGAAAGATLAVDSYTWGPNAESTIPIWYTTLADGCAIQKTSSSTAVTTKVTGRAGVEERGLTATTVSTVVIYTGVSCLATSSINCPASLQTTTTYKSTLTTVLTVSAGTAAVYPASTATTILTTVPFGTNAKALTASTGSPISYTPPPPTSTNAGGGANSSSSSGKTGGINKKLIVGLTVGLGIALIATIITAGFFLVKRQRYSAVPISSTPSTGFSQTFETSEPYRSRLLNKVKGVVHVAVAEIK